MSKSFKHDALKALKLEKKVIELETEVKQHVIQALKLEQKIIALEEKFTQPKELIDDAKECTHSKSHFLVERKLLKDIHTIMTEQLLYSFPTRSPLFSGSELVDSLAKIKNAPWSRMINETGRTNSQPYQWLANQLRPLGIQSLMRHKLKRYSVHSFRTEWIRYGIIK